MQHYLLRQNSNRGGVFRTSVETDRLLSESRRAMADFLNAHSECEIVFGANMTSLTFTLSRAMKHSLNPDDEIRVSRLDHDGNIAPWLRLAADAGARIRWLDFNPTDCTLNMDELKELLSDKTPDDWLRVKRRGNHKPGAADGGSGTLRRRDGLRGRGAVRSPCPCGCANTRRQFPDLHPTVSSGRIRACSGGTTIYSTGCPPTKCVHRESDRQTNLRPAPRITRGRREPWARSNI